MDPKHKENSPTSDAGLNGKFDQEIYRDFYRIATRLMLVEDSGHTLQPTALVNEAWLRINGKIKIDPVDKQHLIAIATRQMRFALVDHARRKKAAKRPYHQIRVSLTKNEAQLCTADNSTIELIDLCVALEDLEKKNQRHCQVFELRFFGGQSVAECASYLGVSERTVKYDWRFATAWIAQRLKLESSP